MMPVPSKEPWACSMCESAYATEHAAAICEDIHKKLNALVAPAVEIEEAMRELTELSGRFLKLEVNTYNGVQICAKYQVRGSDYNFRSWYSTKEGGEDNGE